MMADSPSSGSSMSWMQRLLPRLGAKRSESALPDGLWRRCPKCERPLYGPNLDATLFVCPHCDHHIHVSARDRVRIFLDPSSDPTVITVPESKVDPLSFVDTKKYTDRLKQAQSVTGEEEAIRVVKGVLKGLPVVVSAFEFRFLGGSMSSGVGSRFVAGVQRAIKDKCPMVSFATSGGARMQESLFSLFQMSRAAAALQQLRSKGLPYISVLVDPVYGGVSASLAIIGDVNLAEPDALCGFTGPRVIEQTVRVKLKPGFQRAEFLLDHGSVDRIVHRKHMRDEIHSLLTKLMRLPAQPLSVADARDSEENVSEDASAEN